MQLAMFYCTLAHTHTDVHDAGRFQYPTTLKDEFPATVNEKKQKGEGGVGGQGGDHSPEPVNRVTGKVLIPRRFR